MLAPLAGSISVLAAKYMPGVKIDSEALQGILITGATIAFAKAALWLKGWQDDLLDPDFEADQDDELADPTQPVTAGAAG